MVFGPFQSGERQPGYSESFAACFMLGPLAWSVEPAAALALASLAASTFGSTPFPSQEQRTMAAVTTRRMSAILLIGA